MENAIAPLISLYTPLKEPDGIRLIELQPASEASSDVKCRLIHTSLSDCINDFFGHYITISYVWGDPTETRTIYVDGVPLRITANLFSVLQDSRDETRVLRLWADAVCINQKDLKERAVQVSIMGRIYTGALWAIIYLRPSDPDAREAYCLSAVQEGSVKDCAKMRKSANFILQSEWFTRVWVLQEIVFSHNPWIQCGRTRVRWDRFCEILAKTLDIGTTGADDWDERSLHSNRYQVLSQMQQARAKHQNLKGWIDLKKNDASMGYSRKMGSDNSMLELLQARRSLGVTDPRDMVYAHIGLANDGRGIEVDYSKTCAEIYVDFACRIIKSEGPCTLLSHVSNGRSPRRPESLPSWVPDWTEPQRQSGSLKLSGRPNEAFGNPTPIWFQAPSILAILSVHNEIVVDTKESLDSTTTKRAKLSNGESVIVPGSTQKGDRVSYVHGDDQGAHFVYHLLQGVDQSERIEKGICKGFLQTKALQRLALWFDRRDAANYSIGGELDEMGSLNTILHCKFLGECFRGEFNKRSEEYTSSCCIFALY